MAIYSGTELVHRWAGAIIIRQISFNSLWCFTSVHRVNPSILSVRFDNVSYFAVERRIT